MTARIKGIAARVALALLAAACGTADADDRRGGADYLPSDRYVGLTIEAAEDQANEERRPWRIVRRDGADLPVTEDYSPHRLNFDVDDGVVTAGATDEERAADADRSSESFVGLGLDEAAARAERQGRVWRVISLDGKEQAVTADFQEDRLNFTVQKDVVTAAATDAEMTTTPPQQGCDAELVLAPGVELLGRHDLDGDGRAEFVLLFAGEEVGFTTLLGDDCEVAQVTLDGAPARFPIAFDDATAAGVSCRAEYVDDLYVASLTSQDGESYGGRIAAYNLVDGELVASGGEGAEFDRGGVEALARIECGDAQHP